MAKHINLISYFGGKYPHLNWLIDLFPKGNYHFIDIMCGSANVALNIDYPLITINDLNSDVINLFKVLRTNLEEFMRVLYFTPFSREELYQILDDFNTDCDDVEKARRYFIRSQLGYGANGSQNNHRGAGFEYAIQKSSYYRVDGFNLKMIKLPQIADKLRGFQIENKDVFELFEKVNKKNNIVYFDPPYLMETRTSGKRYKHEVSPDFHATLSKIVKGAKCFVAVSGYDSDTYDKLFPDFYKSMSPPKKSTVSKRIVNECLWTNYDPITINGALKFDFYEKTGE